MFVTSAAGVTQQSVVSRAFTMMKTQSETFKSLQDGNGAYFCVPNNMFLITRLFKWGLAGLSFGLPQQIMFKHQL